ncbi:hypothetical protein T01_7009, partial [Trichinella spiralis]
LSKLENSVPSSHALRERKETIEHLKILLSTNHVWRERKETTQVNFRRNAKRQTTTLVCKITQLETTDSQKALFIEK